MSLFALGRFIEEIRGDSR